MGTPWLGRCRVNLPRKHAPGLTCFCSIFCHANNAEANKNSCVTKNVLPRRDCGLSLPHGETDVGDESCPAYSQAWSAQVSESQESRPSDTHGRPALRRAHVVPEAAQARRSLRGNEARPERDSAARGAAEVIPRQMGAAVMLFRSKLLLERSP